MTYWWRSSATIWRTAASDSAAVLPCEQRAAGPLRQVLERAGGSGGADRSPPTLSSSRAIVRRRHDDRVDRHVDGADDRGRACRRRLAPVVEPVGHHHDRAPRLALRRERPARLHDRVVEGSDPQGWTEWSLRTTSDGVVVYG